MANPNYLFSSESVSEGHPDKVADLISDSVLDAFIGRDPEAHVACETLVTTGLVVMAGEISTRDKGNIDFQKIVRDAIRGIGYTNLGVGFDADSCAILNSLHEQSSDIRQGVAQEKDIGAGDQGMMFGYACDETPQKMPLPIALAHQLMLKQTELRKSGAVKWLRPDAKSQVTIEYRDRKPYRVHTVVLSTQHDDRVTQEELKETIRQKLINAVLPADLIKGEPVVHINPTGRFVTGGPHGDSGVTGRKIIVDTYGGAAPHGGGAFSGKDPTKVDRSAAYYARYVAKNVVAAGLASKFQVQIAYAIGVADPVSVHVEDFGTAKVDLVKMEKIIREIFPMKPADIIRQLDLRKPIYTKTTCYGHFGREDAGLAWEKTDKAEELRRFFS